VGEGSSRGRSRSDEGWRGWAASRLGPTRRTKTGSALQLQPTDGTLPHLNHTIPLDVRINVAGLLLNIVCFFANASWL